MYAQVEKPKENKSRAVVNSVAQKKNVNQGVSFVDNRPKMKQTAQLQSMIDNWSVQQHQSIQKKENNTSNETSNTVIQQTPAEWGAAPQITRVLGHPHGWFSTWKTIKAKIRQYLVLLPGALDARRAKLDEIRPLIVEWENDAKHTAASTEQRVIDIRADMPILKNLIKREYTQIAVAADALTGGHAETRHGADQTDQQLQDRLTTGNDRSGAAASADFSSRFSSHDLLVSTKNTAVNRLNTAKTATTAHLAPLLNDFASKWATFESTPAGAAKGLAGGVRNTARLAIRNAAAAIPLLSPNLFRVDVNNPPYQGATLANIPNRVADMIDIHNRYKIVVNHGQNLGPSFQGTGPHGLIGGAWVPHPGTAPAPAPQGTLTILQPGGGHLNAVGPAAGWPMVTHYPVDTATTPAGISIG